MKKKKKRGKKGTKKNLAPPPPLNPPVNLVTKTGFIVRVSTVKAKIF